MAIRVEHAERIYSTYSGFYDLLFDRLLQPGRERAVEALDVQPGDRILEIGVGTGLSLPLYPRECHITGIDVSPGMIEQAGRRARDMRMRNVSLLKMEAEHMSFPDASFDSVLASYVMSTVADPVRVLHEVHRVCRVGGRIIILNHLRSRNRVIAAFERYLTPVSRRIGFVMDFELDPILNGHLSKEGIEKVNFPPFWSLVSLRKTS